MSPRGGKRPGAGRPSSSSSFELRSLRLQAGSWSAIKREAKARKLGASELARRLIAYGLEHVDEAARLDPGAVELETGELWTVIDTFQRYTGLDWVSIPMLAEKLCSERPGLDWPEVRRVLTEQINAGRLWLSGEGTAQLPEHLQHFHIVQDGKRCTLVSDANAWIRSGLDPEMASK